MAEVYVFPSPGGFVGGDTVAFLFGQIGKQVQEKVEQETTSPSTLFLDMGTNGEIALVVEESIWATSAAAGPAFEGGNLSCGMAALPGAISSVIFEDERVKLATIGNKRTGRHLRLGGHRNGRWPVAARYHRTGRPPA